MDEPEAKGRRVVVVELRPPRLVECYSETVAEAPVWQVEQVYREDGLRPPRRGFLEGQPDGDRHLREKQLE